MWHDFLAGTSKHEIVDPWRSTHKSWEDAEAQIMEVQIAELKAQAQIIQAALAEGQQSENRLIDPTRIV
jgi:hypothetical protein